MSDDFTYRKPNEERYLRALLKYLQAQGENDLYELLKNSTCQIADSGSYSHKRWDAVYTTVLFQVPIDDYDPVDESAQERLIEHCDLIMPKDVGFDVMNVEFSPRFDLQGTTKTLEGDLEEISTALYETQAEFALPDDLLTKGREMAEVYLYLYAVENYLRVFIESVGIEEYGQNYFDSFTVPRSVREGIERRKRQEEQNQWIRVRGDSELFYLDFTELGTLILNNWELFKAYFPDQSWISSKIDELYSCRNLVAHNSYVGEHERDIIRVNFRSIVRQLNS